MKIAKTCCGRDQIYVDHSLGGSSSRSGGPMGCTVGAEDLNRSDAALVEESQVAPGK